MSGTTSDSSVYATVSGVPTTIDGPDWFSPKAFVNYGTTTINAPTSGAGTFLAGPSLTINSYVSPWETIGVGYSSALVIGNPYAFYGQIEAVNQNPIPNAPVGSYVELAGLGNATGYKMDGNQLVLTENGNSIYTLNLAPGTSFSTVFTENGNAYLANGYGAYKVGGTQHLLTEQAGSGSGSGAPGWIYSLPSSGAIPANQIAGGIYETSASAAAPMVVNGPGLFAPNLFVDDGAAVINANVGGYGSFVTGEGSSLTFGGYVDPWQTVGLALNASITIEQPSQFNGQLAMVQTTTPQSGPFGEYVDLQGLANADSYSLQNDLLTIMSGGKALDQVSLAAGTNFTGFYEDQGSVYLTAGYGFDKIPSGAKALVQVAHA
jgi:hypothetical protein